MSHNFSNVRIIIFIIKTSVITRVITGRICEFIKDYYQFRSQTTAVITLSKL